MLRTLLVLGGLAAANMAFAQTPSLQQVLDVTQALSERRTVSCGNTQVPAYVSLKMAEHIPHNGELRATTSGNIMLLSPAAANAARPLARFIQAHECQHELQGHLKLMKALGLHKGHAAANGRQHRKMELEADCAAVKNLQAEGDLIAIAAGLSWLEVLSLPASPTHPSTSERIANIQACLVRA